MFWHAGSQGGGWPMSSHYYLTAHPLGIFSWDVHMMNPVLFMEWLIGPALFYLLYRALKNHSAKSYLILMTAPFIIAGGIAFMKDWNYRFYKNFTYFYFWLPLGVGLVASSITSKTLRKIFTYMLVLTALFAATRLGRGMYIWTLLTQPVPTELRSLEPVTPRITAPAVYAAGLSFWEQLCRNICAANLVLAEFNGYLRNDTGSLKDPRFRFLLTKGKFDTISLEGRTVEEQIWQNEPYTLYSLK